MKSPQVIGILDPFSHEHHVDIVKCDILEFCADLFQDSESCLKALREYKSHYPDKIFLATVRLEKDGGCFSDNDVQDRKELFLRLIQSGLIDWIDLELEEIESYSEIVQKARLRNISVLVSHHNFNDSYDLFEFEAKLYEMKKFDVDGYKFAVTFRQSLQYHQLKAFAKSHVKTCDKLLALFSMGALGKDSRIDLPKMGIPWTYGYFGNKEHAPGQHSITALHQELKL